MIFRFQNYSNLLWEKIVLVIKKNFWNLRLKAKNLQKPIYLNSERFWNRTQDTLENLIVVLPCLKMQLDYEIWIHVSMSESLKRKMKKAIVRSPIELCQFKLQKMHFRHYSRTRNNVSSYHKVEHCNHL